MGGRYRQGGGGNPCGNLSVGQIKMEECGCTIQWHHDAFLVVKEEEHGSNNNSTSLRATETTVKRRHR